MDFFDEKIIEFIKLSLGKVFIRNFQKLKRNRCLKVILVRNRDKVMFFKFLIAVISRLFLVFPTAFTENMISSEYMIEQNERYWNVMVNLITK